MNPLTQAALAMLLGVSSFGALAQPTPPLTLAAAQAAAIERSMSLAATEAMASAARQRAVAAGQRPDPVLRLSLDNLPVDGPDRFKPTRDFMTMRTASWMQMLPREEKRRAAASRSEREAEVALAERSLRTLALAREVALAYFERHAAEQQLALLAQQHEEVQLQQRAAEAALRAGRGMAGDILAARDAALRLQQERVAAETMLANAQRQLARYTGLPPTMPLAPPPATSVLTRPAQQLTGELHRHADVGLVDARASRADAEVEMARQERTPDWSVELMFSRRGSAYSNMVSLAFSVPLPWDRPQRQDRELAARLAEREQLRAEREEMQREHQAQTENWLAGWQAARARLGLLQNERLPLAQQRVELALAAYRGGSAPLAQALEARRMALELQAERIQLELEAARLWAQLETLVPAGSPAHASGHSSVNDERAVRPAPPVGQGAKP